MPPSRKLLIFVMSLMVIEAAHENGEDERFQRLSRYGEPVKHPAPLKLNEAIPITLLKPLSSPVFVRRFNHHQRHYEYHQFA